MDKKLRENEKYYHNKELFEEAIKHNLFIPNKHYLAKLDKFNLRNDFKKMYLKTDFNPDERAYNLAWKAFDAVYGPYMRDCKTITLDEAIGVASKHAAPGILYKQMGFKDKEAVFLKMKDEIGHMISDIGLEKLVQCIWETSPKIEIRSLEKIINEDFTKNKQRTFLVADVLNYIVGLILYFIQNQRMLIMSENHEYPAVGDSIFYGGWNDLATNMYSKGRHKIASYDIKQMEASINDRILDDLYKWRNSYLPNDKCTRTLATWFVGNKIYSLVVDIDGNLAIKIGKNPSGCGNTLTDNTWITCFIQFYNYAKGCDTVIEIVQMHDDTPAEIVGDDLIILLTDYIKSNLCKNSLEIGFTLELESEGYLEDIRFLNFGFKYNFIYHMWTFEPNYDKLFASLYYYRKNNSWRLTYAKLCAMKVLCYNSKPHYDAVNYFISYIWNYHMVDMRNEHNMEDKIPFSVLRTLEMKEDDISYLIYGLERAL